MIYVATVRKKQGILDSYRNGEAKRGVCLFERIITRLTNTGIIMLVDRLDIDLDAMDSLPWFPHLPRFLPFPRVITTGFSFTLSLSSV